jgi:hypothetical protein
LRVTKKQLSCFLKSRNLANQIDAEILPENVNNHNECDTEKKGGNRKLEYAEDQVNHDTENEKQSDKNQKCMHGMIS